MSSNRPAPWTNQTEGIERALAVRETVGGFLLWHDMGTGKTYTTLLLSEHLDAKAILALTLKTVIPTWVKEFQSRSKEPVAVFTAKKSWTVPQTVEKLEKFLDLNRRIGRKHVVVLNYDKIWREGLGPYRYEDGTIYAKGTLENHFWNLIAADEIQRIKSPDGNTNAMMRRLIKVSGFRVGLSGTPFDNSPLDVFGVYRFLAPDIFGPNYTLFKARYAVMGGYENRQVQHYVNEDELWKKIHSIAHRAYVDDVVDLPETLHQAIPVEMSAKTMRLYNELDKEMALELDTGATITPKNVLVKNLRLAQLLSGALRADDGETVQVDSAKPEALAELIAGTPQETPWVVFTRFTHDVDQVRQVAEKLGRSFCELTGRRDQLAVFKRGDADIIGVNIRAGGAGVDLTRARYCCYYSKGYENGAYNQSLARLRRPGADLDHRIRYYHLISYGTIEERIQYAIEHKQNIIETVLEYYRGKRAA